MEAYFLTLRSFQNDLQPFSDGSGISGKILVDRRGKHPTGGYRFLVYFEDAEDRRRENNAAIGCFRLGWRNYQLSLDPVDLSFNPEFSGAEVQIIPLEGADLTPVSTPI